jgi:hypothetical protein
MENKTALQQAFSDLEEMHPHLFNTFSQEGRDFVYHFHKYLAIEKKQIIDAYKSCEIDNTGELITAQEYYNRTFNK